MVPQAERLREPAEAVRVLGGTGYRQQLVDAARGQHQPVIGQFTCLPLGIGAVHPSAGEVSVFGLARYEPYTRQRSGE
ncbi:hypothetical protein GCM10018773_09940 [Streptomyces candidus]|nr:hypothetical protein GCM10018773_09940 [Streptomyces candidus]